MWSLHGRLEPPLSLSQVQTPSRPVRSSPGSPSLKKRSPQPSARPPLFAMCCPPLTVTGPGSRRHRPIPRPTLSCEASRMRTDGHFRARRTAACRPPMSHLMAPQVRIIIQTPAPLSMTKTPTVTPTWSGVRPTIVMRTTACSRMSRRATRRPRRGPAPPITAPPIASLKTSLNKKYPGAAPDPCWCCCRCWPWPSSSAESCTGICSCRVLRRRKLPNCRSSPPRKKRPRRIRSLCSSRKLPYSHPGASRSTTAYWARRHWSRNGSSQPRRSRGSGRSSSPKPSSLRAPPTRARARVPPGRNSRPSHCHFPCHRHPAPVAPVSRATSSSPGWPTPWRRRALQSRPGSSCRSPPRRRPGQATRQTGKRLGRPASSLGPASLCCRLFRPLNRQKAAMPRRHLSRLIPSRPRRCPTLRPCLRLPILKLRRRGRHRTRQSSLNKPRRLSFPVPSPSPRWGRPPMSLSHGPSPSRQPG
jgi:hypothetical protein